MEKRIKSQPGFIFSFSMVSHILYLFKQIAKEKIAKYRKKHHPVLKRQASTCCDIYKNIHKLIHVKYDEKIVKKY